MKNIFNKCQIILKLFKINQLQYKNNSQIQVVHAKSSVRNQVHQNSVGKPQKILGNKKLNHENQHLANQNENFRSQKIL